MKKSSLYINIPAYIWVLLGGIFAYNCLLQIENILISVPAGKQNLYFIDLFLQLLLGQTQQIIFLLILGVCFWLRGQSKTSKWLAFILSLFIVIYLTLNQLFFEMYFFHFRVGFDPEGQQFSLALLKDSLISIITPVFYIHLFLVAFFTFWAYRKIILKPDKIYSYPLKRVMLLIAFTAIYFIAAYLYKGTNNITKNPFFALVESIYDSSRKQQLVNNDDKNVLNNLKIYRPLFSEQKTVDTAINSYINKSRQSDRKPNIIYIVLESVGAVNILDSYNQLNQQLTPNLYSIRDKILLFPWICNTFPGTTRSHIPLLTGGNTITYGDFSEQITHQYYGPTLISELKKAGYRTSLFTSQFMNFGSLDGFYMQLPFDYRYMPEQLEKNYIDKYKMNSWGIDEIEPYISMQKWINKHQNKQPFFVEFMNVGTHHPYSIPNNYQKAFDGTDNLTKYKNAIHYADYILGKTIAYLKEKNLYNNTIICISGDHGQAFGKWHQKNLLHKNYIYEENVRNFFIVIDPRKQNGQLTSSKRAFIGDIMPTILSFTGRNVKGILGQNLLSANYQNKIHFFHKNSYPEIWGLKDGDWKFIVEKLDKKNPELYNLKTDPNEQHNLAYSYPERVKTYQKLLPTWYLQTNKMYEKHLKGYKSDKEFELKEEDLITSGPKYIAFGNINAEKEFSKKEVINPKEKFYVRIKLTPYDENTQLKCSWVSPSGKEWTEEFYIEKDWTTAWKSFERKTDPEEGIWQCVLMKGDQVLINKTFIISSKATITEEYFYKKGPVRLFFGIKDDKGFIPLDELHPKESTVVFSQINPYDTDKELEYVWISPLGKKHNYKVLCKAGWNYTWCLLNEGQPMEEGKWKMAVFLDKKKLQESSFIVSHEAKLHQLYTEQK